MASNSRNHEMEVTTSSPDGSAADMVNNNKSPGGMPMKPFVLKKWNLVGMWEWDVECDRCAICRLNTMDSCLRCQTDNRVEECVVVWGECSHVFHNCCMSQWIKQNNRCPLCQKDWKVKRIGK